MVSVRVTKEGWQFLSLLTGAGCFCSLEYYLYYRFMPSFTCRTFQSTALPDKPEYAKEVVVGTGKNKFAFRHKGGSQAMESVVKDAYSSSRFRRVLGLQFGSVFAIGLGLLKKKRALTNIAVAMLAANMLLAFPTIQSSANLHRLASLVANGNEEVWENLNEIRFVQRIDESASSLLRYSELVGMSSVILCSLYLTPFLTVFTSGIVGVYLHNQKATQAA